MRRTCPRSCAACYSSTSALPGRSPSWKWWVDGCGGFNWLGIFLAVSLQRVPNIVVKFVLKLSINERISAGGMTSVIILHFNIIHAFITSKLDYNGLSSVPDTLLGKLQKVQNVCAKLIFRTKKFDHVTNLMRKLHWLPIKLTIDFKVRLLTYNYCCWPTIHCRLPEVAWAKASSSVIKWKTFSSPKVHS